MLLILPLHGNLYDVCDFIQHTLFPSPQLSTDTGASKARKDFPRILLYPERTILHNNTSRIRSYQDSGTMSRQKELARREKWYN